MKFSRKNLRIFSLFLFLGAVIGTLAFDIIEKIITLFWANFSFSTGAIGFDISLISFYMKLNPGTLLGTAAGYSVFRRL